MKDHLIFDTTDSTTIADSDSVGAYLRSADGTLLTHTDVGGKKALDVRVAEGINVEVDLDAADDSVSSWTKDGAGTAITSTLNSGKQGLDVNIINSLTVSDVALGNVTLANAANTLSVADTAQDVIAAPLANRKYVYLYNNDNTKIFIGTTGVTAANGFPISPGSYMELRAGAAVAVQFVGQANKTPSIRSLELS